MYLIWILGSKLILSNDQSRATLWVLDIMSHCRASSFDDHLYHCFIVFKDVQQSLLTRRMHVWGNKINIVQIINHSMRFLPRLKFAKCCTNQVRTWWEELTFEGIKSTLSKSLITPWDCFSFWIVWGVERTSRLFINGSLRSLWLWYVFSWRTATIRSHKSSAGIPSNLNPASKGMISDSVELCETEVCFLHIQLIGTNAWRPKMHNAPPDVDFESSRSLARSESWNSPSLHCLAVLPTWQYCLYSHVWWM